MASAIKVAAADHSKFWFSLIVALLIAACGGLTGWFERNGDTPTALDQAEKDLITSQAWIVALSQSDTANPISEKNWDSIVEPFEKLHFHNRNIFKARLLCTLDQPPQGLYKSSWTNREENKTDSIQIRTPFTQARQAIIYMISSFICALPLIWLAAFLIHLSWNFILKRIAELSSAIRGRMH